MRKSALAVALVALAFALAGPGSAAAAPPAFGPNVVVFTPSMPQSQIQATLDAISEAASVEPVRLAALRRLVRARHVRQRAEPARVPARLLHAGRRPRRHAERRRDQRRRRRLQPVRQLGYVRRPDQLLAFAVELDPERDAAGHAAGLRPGERGGRRLQELERPVRCLAGIAGAQRDRQRRADPAGLLQPRLRERRLLRQRRAQRIRRQLRPAAVLHAQQQRRPMVERRLEPGLSRRQRGAGDRIRTGRRPVHERAVSPRLAGAAVPDDRRRWELERLPPGSAAQLRRPELRGRLR